MDIIHPHSILVLRFSSLGDVVLTTALLPNLKAIWPNAKITVATRATFAPVFDRNPHVDQVAVFDGATRPFSQLAMDVRRQHWDVVIDLHANLRSWLIRLVAAGGRTVVVDKVTGPRWALLFTKKMSARLIPSVRERILATLEEIDVPVKSAETQLFPSDPRPVFKTWGVPLDRTLIGVAPGARHATKRWPAEHFAEAANDLARRHNAAVVILGDRSDKAAADAVAAKLTVDHVDLTGKTSLGDLVAVTSKLSFLLTNDSGLMHIAEALKVPLVAIFGPTVRGFGFAPYRETSRLVENNHLSCRPCTLHGDERCPLGHHKCMKDVGAPAVIAASEDVLGRVEKGAA